MKPQSFFKSLLTGVLTLTGIGLASLIPTPPKAIAAFGDTPTCPSTGNTDPMSEDCLATPEIMEITFYELGFCASTSPLAGANFSRANCEKVWESDVGQTVDLAAYSYKGLAGSGTYKIPAGTYNHAYVIIGHTWGIKGKTDFNGQTYFTTSDGNGAYEGTDPDMSSYAKYNLEIGGLGGGEGCWDSPETTTAGYGTTKAYLTDSSLTTASNTATCESATRFIGSIELETPVTITSSTKTYGLTWTITDMGLWVIYPGSGIHPSDFGVGPFLPIFSFE